MEAVNHNEGSLLTTSKKDQKRMVKEFMKTSLVEKSIWNVVSNEWFVKWKQYVDYDTKALLPSFGRNDDNNYPSPGPIDNTNLLKDGTEELILGLNEEEHYVLVPNKCYTYLESIYGGGPSITREAITQGKQVIIDMFPIKVFVFEEANAEEPATSLFLSKTFTLFEVKNAIVKSLDKTGQDCRLWIKLSELDAANIENSEDSRSKKRKTAELTDIHGRWRYIRDLNSVSLSDIDSKEVSVLIEFRDPQSNVWPRDTLLNKWKDSLCAGDIVDAMDNLKDWYESEIVSIDKEKGEFVVHFKGWAPRFNQTYKLNRLLEVVQPLYTMTTNWRDSLNVGSQLEYAVSVQADGSRWIAAVVIAIDSANHSVKVSYTDANEQGVSDFIDIYSERICKSGTHIKLEKQKEQRATTTSTGTGYLSGMYSSMTSAWNYRSHQKGIPPEPGAVGLMNLRNTCFMNSMLQCISNTDRIRDIFLSDRYVSQLNPSNPLGHGGKVAGTFAKLLKDIWSGQYTVVVPDEFKRTIGEFRPQFSGYQQQDSQEFMLFLLDGLHEDMNRILKKPYVEAADYDGRPDLIIAQECWGRFLLRNDSEMVDSCFGQLKSHLTCRNCHFESVTFDEYSSLSLPLPIKNVVPVSFLFFPLPYGSQPLSVTLEIDVGASLGDLVKLIRTQIAPPTASKNSSNGESEDYVLIDKDADDTTTPTEDGELVNKTQSSSSESRTNGNSNDDGFYLHVCTASKTYQRLFRTHDMKTSLRDINRSMYDAVCVYQLQHEVPPETYGYVPNHQQTKSPYAVCDVTFAHIVKSPISHYSSMTFEPCAPCQRFSYIRNTTTVWEVRKIVWKLMQRYLSEDYLSSLRIDEDGIPGDLPYKIMLVQSYATGNKSELSGGETPESTDIFEPSVTESLIVCWEKSSPDFDTDTLQEPSREMDLTTKDKDGKKTINVNHCLDKFIEREQMPEEETWYCPKCKVHLAPLKKFDLWSTPDVLVIHLKRFQYVPGAHFIYREKINEMVDFPIEGLDLTNYIKGPISSEAPPIYDLHGVSEHIGGLGGGHYTAVCQNPKSKKWYSFNDSHCSPCSPEEALSSRAYVLFYTRRQGRLQWAGMQPSYPPKPEKQT